MNFQLQQSTHLYTFQNVFLAISISAESLRDASNTSFSMLIYSRWTKTSSLFQHAMKMKTILLRYYTAVQWIHTSTSKFQRALCVYFCFIYFQLKPAFSPEVRPSESKWKTNNATSPLSGDDFDSTHFLWLFDKARICEQRVNLTQGVSSESCRYSGEIV